jgi:pyruvate ferredoxin oxidoreductase alpha subunit
MPTREALTGNEAVAFGVRLSRTKVIAAYPITPQSPIVENISKFVAEGTLDAEFVESEGEHGVFGTLIGAALNGVRTFSATCSQGFLFGYENIAWVPGQRLPVVAAITNRLYAAPGGIWCDHSDSMTAKDLGWIQLYVESPQEALDTIIQAYRIAEDQNVLLPVFVCLDGFTVSHTKEVVEVPNQEEVDAYIPPYEQKHILLDPRKPMEMLSGTLNPEGHLGLEYLRKEAMSRAKAVIQQANNEFARNFGRSYGNGLVERFNCDDAEAIVIAMGSMTGDAKKAVEEMRAEGRKVGLARLRSFRPFPKEEFLDLAKKTKVIAVADRSISRGLDEGAVFTEAKSTLYNFASNVKVIGFIAGLRGNEVLVSDFKYMLDRALKVVRDGEIDHETEWIPNVEVTVKSLSPNIPDELYYPGAASCPGCGMASTFRHLVETLGKDIIVVRTAGCQAWVSTGRGKTCAGVPLGRAVLPGGASLATGLTRALQVSGRSDEAEVVLFGGDGSIGDMGILALSGAAERNEDIIVVVYDNESYANTGVQRSGTTPRFARTTTSPVGAEGRGKKRPAKDLPLIVAAHKVPYVATASISYIEDFRKKLKEAKQMRGFRYIHVHIPCPTSWGFPPEKSVAIERLAVATRMHPLYEIENGKLRMTYRPKDSVPIMEYLKSQRRFSHLTDEEADVLQGEVDHKWTELELYEQHGLTLFAP